MLCLTRYTARPDFGPPEEGEGGEGGGDLSFWYSAISLPATLRSDREREERASEGSARFYKPKSDSDHDFQRNARAAESGEKGKRSLRGGKSESALHLAI